MYKYKRRELKYTDTTVVHSNLLTRWICYLSNMIVVKWSLISLKRLADKAARRTQAILDNLRLHYRDCIAV
jgi:hypothetical protein